MLIDDIEGLQRFAGTIGEDETIGVDTEFMRERTYYPALCLMQIATHSTSACIDVLAIEDLSVVQELLLDSRRVKIFHAARQDLEVLFQRFGAVPEPVFDTQVAAGFCGIGDQIGYAGLVEKLTNQQLAKEQTRTDWSKRPLTRDQIEYALADVAYLHDLATHLQSELSRLKRYDWFEDEMQRLRSSDLYTMDPAHAWQRVGAIAGLNSPAQWRAQRLCEWRELAAQHRNLPRAWILKDRQLLELAEVELDPTQDISAIGPVATRLYDRWGEEFLDLLRDPVDGVDQPLTEGGRRLTIQENALRKRMMTTLRSRASELNMTPSLLGNRSDIERFIKNPGNSPLIRGWRESAIGLQLQAIRSEVLETD